MGIKGRRVHMIEELSETVISFQRGKIVRPVWMETVTLFACDSLTAPTALAFKLIKRTKHDFFFNALLISHLFVTICKAKFQHHKY